MFNGLRSKLNEGPFTDIDVSQTAINELANKPRYDIDNRRYGNTLSDDMFAIKNAGRPNQHTPESYDYFGDPNNKAPYYGAMGTANYGQEQIPVLSAHDALMGRKKNVTGESNDWEAYKDWGLSDDILEFPENYTQDALDWAESLRDRREAADRVAQLSTDSLRNEKFGSVSDDMGIRHDAEFDPYLNELVNYNALSPATVEQLVKMGVNRPTFDEYEDYGMARQDVGFDSNETLNNLLSLYKYAMENGYR